MNMRTNRQSGQTLIIALLIMGVLLILGFVFTGIISRGIFQTSSAFRRTQATDLAEAGARFAHYQLQYSDLAADWRPSPTLMATDVAGYTRDPDAWFLRPRPVSPSYLRDRLGNAIPDLGGPDGLGPFSRMEFEKGRALVRVLYNPTQFAGFNGNAYLREPARARSLVLIESVGRPGKVSVNDPTTLNSEALKVNNYTGLAEFDDQMGKLRAQSTRIAETRKLVAFASVTNIEYGYSIMDKFHVSRPAEIGAPTDSLNLLATSTSTDPRGDLGITYEGQRVVVPFILGSQVVTATGTNLVRGTGSLFSNADLLVHGDIRVSVDPRAGDKVLVAGKITPANNAARFEITRTDASGTNVFNVAGQGMASTNPGFSTYGGVFRDGTKAVDGAGQTRAVNRIEPPSFVASDPATGVNRYTEMTRQSGRQIVGGQFGGRNSGQWGHGSGIYVDSNERGNYASESDRENGDPAKTLTRDWLNPNNPDSVAWKGPFYIPVAAYCELLPDGFRIIRDARSRSRIWRREDGTMTGTSEARFRILYPGRFGRKYIINSIAHPDLIDLPYNSIPVASVQNRGWEFNGVLQFEGDVRVRGIIPTLEQLTLTSLGSIYIEGSITKGVVSPVDGTVLSVPSPATIMLAAKDYVCVNTTMFTGPAPGESVSPKRTDRLPNTPNPVELDQSERQTLTLQTQFLRDPYVTATGLPNPNPQTWAPFATEYTEARDNQPITSSLLLAHSADNSGPSFFSLSSTPFGYMGSVGDPVNQKYIFGFNVGQDYNVEAGQLFSAANLVSIYGLTNTTQTAFPRFETASYPLIDSSFTVTSLRLTGQTPVVGASQVYAIDDETRFTITPEFPASYQSQNYELARAALQPSDIRIQAAIYAEEGSFFVIPGPAFNLNPDDTRDRFMTNVTSIGIVQAQLQRYRDFGNRPSVPFFGEPLNCRVSIIGSVSENMPVPMSERAEWLKKWGWMPRFIGGAGGSGNPSDPPVTTLNEIQMLPVQHVPNGWPLDTGTGAPDNTNARFVPNLSFTYDPVFAVGSANGVDPIRRSDDGLWTLPPMPRLPVSPTLAYFGEVNP